MVFFLRPAKGIDPKGSVETLLPKTTLDTECIAGSEEIKFLAAAAPNKNFPTVG
jgi:hypothetical protein